MKIPPLHRIAISKDDNRSTLWFIFGKNKILIDCTHGASLIPDDETIKACGINPARNFI